MARGPRQEGQVIGVEHWKGCSKKILIAIGAERLPTWKTGVVSFLNHWAQRLITFIQILI